MGAFFHWIALHWFVTFLLAVCLFLFIAETNWYLLFNKNGYRPPNAKFFPGVRDLLVIAGVLLSIYLYFQLSAIKHWFTNVFAGFSAWIDDHVLGIFTGIVLLVVISSIGYWLSSRAEKPKKKDLYDEIMEERAEPISAEHVITCPGAGIVRYQIAETTIAGYALKSLALKSDIEQKIREILETDPDANLKEYEGSLGIKVLSYRRAGRARGKSGYVGWNE